MRFRDFSKMHRRNDGTRTLLESIPVLEVEAALRDWSRAGTGGVLIGGIALSFHAKPRTAAEIDLLFPGADAVPDRVPGFERAGPRALLHGATRVGVRVVVPETAGPPVGLCEKVAETATESDGVRVASASGLVALLLRRASLQDKADIVALLKTGRVDISGFPLPAEEVGLYRTLVAAAATDPHDD